MGQGVDFMRSVFAAALLLALLWPVIGAAGWIEDRDGTTVIHVKVFDLPDPTNTDTYNRSEVAGVEAFKKRFSAIFAEKYRDEYKANPDTFGHYNWDDVRIELEKFTGIQVEGVEVDLLAIAGGLAPDILYVNFRKSDTYIQNGFLYPLDRPEDKYLAGMTEDEIEFRIHPKIWPVIRRKGPEGEKHVWAIPHGGALGRVVLYRKDLFDRKGIPYPDVNWTWDDMMDAARKLTDPNEGTYGVGLGRGKHESWFWVSWLWSMGQEVMTYDEETDQWTCVFDTPEAAVALDYYTRLSAESWVDDTGKTRRGYSTKDVSDAGQKWERGEVGMIFSYVDEKVFATINPEVTGMVPFPIGPTGHRGSELNSRMMGLFSDIKEPAVRDAAWEYMRFYDSKEAVGIKTRVMVEGGLGRFVNPKYLRMFGYPEIERLSPKGWSETFEIAIDTGRPEPYGRNSNIAYDMMTLPIQKAEQMSLNDQLPEDPQERLEVLHGLLIDGCRRANAEMIGLITPQERLKRRVAAVIMLVAIIITFILVLRNIARSFTPPHTAEGQQKKWAFRKYAWAYILLLPALLTIAVWQYVPLIRGSIMAFMDYRILGESTWVGVDNFGDLLFDSYWWQSVWNALRYSFLVMSLTFLPPIILAILLQEVPRGKLLFRTIYYLPAVITGLVTILLWKQFYEPSERGALNALMLNIPMAGFLAVGLILFLICFFFAKRLLLHRIFPAMWGFLIVGILLFWACAAVTVPVLLPTGETFAEALASLPARLFQHLPEPYRWLSDPDTAMLSCVLPMVWAGMGPGCLIYLAALKGIPNDYYEAADIDGASFIDKILFVVFPMLKALIIINFVGVFITSWYGAAGNILVMTGGAANTEIVDLHIWYKAFTFLKFGPATAMAWMLGFMLIGFTVHQLRILSRVEFRTAGEEKT